MTIDFRNGNVSEYDNMMVYIRAVEVNSPTLIYYPDEKALSSGIVVGIFKETEIADNIDDYATVDEIIDKLDSKLEYSNTAEFIVDGIIYYVAIKELASVAYSVEATDIDMTNSEYC